LETHLIGKHIPTIMQKGLDNLLDEHRISDLKLLYQLISRNGIEQFNGTEQLKKAYSEYIKVGSFDNHSQWIIII
jgi:cullin-4